MDPLLKSTTSLPLGIETSSITPAISSQELLSRQERGNWSEFSCSWLDEVYDIQNDFYWRHTSSTEILVLYAVVCTFGGIANLFVIIAFLRTSHLRNLRNYFIVNLAFSDLMLSCLTAPATLYLTLNLFWPFGNLACQMMASVQAVNTFVSCLTLVLIAMDRFLLTLCPVEWRMAAKAPIFCYSIVWFTSVLVAAPYFFAVAAEPVAQFDPWNTPQVEYLLEICNRDRPEICLEKTWHRLPFSRQTYTLTVLAIQYILPLSALQIGSTIVKRVKHNTTVDQQRRNLLNRRNRKALILLLALIITYAVAWLPINAYNVLNVVGLIEFSQYRYIFCHLIGMCSACINPLLYALINDSFRTAFIAMLSPLFGPCTKYVVVAGGGSSAFGNRDSDEPNNGRNNRGMALRAPPPTFTTHSSSCNMNTERLRTAEGGGSPLIMTLKESGKGSGVVRNARKETLQLKEFTPTTDAASIKLIGIGP